MQGSALGLTSMKSLVFKLALFLRQSIVACLYFILISGCPACFSAAAHMHASAHTLIFLTCFGGILTKLILQGFPLMRGGIPLLHTLLTYN